MTANRRNNQSDRVDHLLVEACVRTGRPGDPVRADWGVALREGRIVAVGPSYDLFNLKGPHTAVTRLRGRTLAPGFVDAHVHLLTGGLDLFRVDLRGVRSPEEFMQRVQDRVRTTPEGEWIQGGGWDENEWGGPLPDRSWLDRITPDHPVFLLRNDLHVALANGRALERAGSGPCGPEMDHPWIDRGPDGRPTGILREAALEWFAPVVPPPTAAERRAALRAAMHHALSMGVTQVHDMGALQSVEESRASLAALRMLEARGRLPIRVYAQHPLSERRELARRIEEEGRGSDRLRWGGVKGFVDGTLGASTAWMREPYAHDPGTAGSPVTDLDELRAGILEAAELGLQPINHAIGDRAADWLLDVYHEAIRRNPGADLRPRIEHAQHLSDEAIACSGAHGGAVHFSMQPAHLLADGSWAGERIGEERMRGAFAFRRLLDAGARVSFGSDWTVAPMNPRIAIEAALTRRHRGGGVFGSGQELRLDEALHAHTLEGARAGFMEDSTGSLEVGKWGDLVVLDAEGAPERTLVGGALMWRRDETKENP